MRKNIFLFHAVILLLFTETVNAYHGIRAYALFNPLYLTNGMRNDAIWPEIGYFYGISKKIDLNIGFSTRITNKTGPVQTTLIGREYSIPLRVEFRWFKGTEEKRLRVGIGCDMTYFKETITHCPNGDCPLIEYRGFYPIIDFSFRLLSTHALSFHIINHNIIDYHLFWGIRPTLGVTGQYDF